MSDLPPELEAQLADLERPSLQIVYEAIGGVVDDPQRDKLVEAVMSIFSLLPHLFGSDDILESDDSMAILIRSILPILRLEMRRTSGEGLAEVLAAVTGTLLVKLADAGVSWERVEHYMQVGREDGDGR